jgi:hypothetical protein
VGNGRIRISVSSLSGSLQRGQLNLTGLLAIILILVFLVQPIRGGQSEFMLDTKDYYEKGEFISIRVMGPSETPFSIAIISPSGDKVFSKITSTDRRGIYNLYLPGYGETGCYTLTLVSGNQEISGEFGVRDACPAPTQPEPEIEAVHPPASPPPQEWVKHAKSLVKQGIEKEEFVRGREKKVVVSSEEHRINVDVSTELPEIGNVNWKLFWVEENRDVTRDLEVNFEVTDTDGNGLTDFASWTVPHLSTQTFILNSTAEGKYDVEVMSNGSKVDSPSTVFVGRETVQQSTNADSYATSSGGVKVTNPQNVENAPDTQYATFETADSAYGSSFQNLGGTLDHVWICAYFYSSAALSDDTLELRYTLNNGGGFTSVHTWNSGDQPPLSNSERCYDVTSHRSWVWSGLTTSNTWVQLYGVKSKNTDATIYADALYWNVTYITTEYVYHRYYSKFNISDLPSGITINDAKLSYYVSTASATASGEVYHTDETFTSATPVSTIYADGKPGECVESNPIGALDVSSTGYSNVTVATAVNETYKANKDLIAFMLNETGEDDSFSVYGSSRDGSEPKLYVIYTDTSEPAYTNQGQNDSSPSEGDAVKAYAYWDDNIELGYAWLQTNKTGIFADEGSPVSLSTTPSWSNFTIGTTGYASKRIAWRIYANDTEGQQNQTDDMDFMVSDSEYPEWSANNTSPPSGVTYSPGASYQFNITWTDNAGISDVVLEFDGDNYTYLNSEIIGVGNEYYRAFTDLSCGNHNYRWYANDTSGNMNSTDSLVYVIQKAGTSINLLLNESDLDRAYNYSQTANMTVVASVSGNVELWTNLSGESPSLWDSDASPLENYTVLAYSLGVYNITGIFPENENYTTSYETHWLTIEDHDEPDYFDASENMTLVHKTGYVELRTRWTDNYQLDAALLATNESGAYMNVSSTDISGNDDWANFTYRIPAGVNTGLLAWKQYANDTSNNWNVSAERTVEIWGWSNTTTYLNTSSLQVGQGLLISCLVRDADDAGSLPGYYVEIYYNGGMIDSGSTDAGGWRNYTYSPGATGTNIPVKCALYDNSTQKYNATYNDTDYVTVTVGAPPKLYDGIYDTDVSAIYNGEAILIYAKWNENLDYSYVEFDNATLGEWVTQGLNPPYTGNWTNHTLVSNFGWALGQHQAKIYANNAGGAMNATLERLPFDVWGWSRVDYDSPASGEYYRGNLQLKCNVTDANDSAPVENALVNFYNYTVKIGSNKTESDGVALYKWGTTYLMPGIYSVTCNITQSNSSSYYNATVYQTGAQQLTLKGELNASVDNPAENTLIHRGDSIWLNSTTRDENDLVVASDAAEWFDDTGNVGNTEDYYWSVPVTHSLGYSDIMINVTKQYYDYNSTNATLLFYGWAELNQSYLNASTIDENHAVNFSCRVRDANTTDVISGYIIQFYNSTGSIGSDTTNENGWAGVIYTDKSPRNENLVCNITDDAALYYNGTASYQKSESLTTNDITEPLYFDLSPDEGQVLHKNENIVFEARWTDNYQLDAALLATNESGGLANVSLYGSPKSLSGTEMWSNFTWTKDDYEGALQWQVWANDTASNTNKTTVREIEVWGWAEVSSITLTPSTISPGGSTQIRCTVMDNITYIPLQGYKVNFYNSTQSLGTNHTNADGYAYITSYTDDDVGAESIKCNITDNSTLFYNDSSENWKSATLTVQEGYEEDTASSAEQSGGVLETSYTKSQNSDDDEFVWAGVDEDTTEDNVYLRMFTNTTTPEFSVTGINFTWEMRRAVELYINNVWTDSGAKGSTGYVPSTWDFNTTYDRNDGAFMTLTESSGQLSKYGYESYVPEDEIETEYTKLRLEITARRNSSYSTSTEDLELYFYNYATWTRQATPCITVPDTTTNFANFSCEITANVEQFIQDGTGQIRIETDDAGQSGTNAQWDVDYWTVEAYYDNPSSGNVYSYRLGWYNFSSGSWVAETLTDITGRDDTVEFFYLSGSDVQHAMSPTGEMRSYLTVWRSGTPYASSQMRRNDIKVDYFTAALDYTTSSVKKINITVTNASGDTVSNTEIWVYNQNNELVAQKTISEGDSKVENKLSQNYNYTIITKSPADENYLVSKIVNINISADREINPQIVDNYTGELPSSISYIYSIYAIDDSGLKFEYSSLQFPLEDGDVPDFVVHCKDWDFDAGDCNSWEVNASSDYGMQNNSTHMWFNVTHFQGQGGGTQGWLEVTLNVPPDDTVIPHERNFTVNATAICRDFNCGDVSGTGLYNGSVITDASRATPFYTFDTQLQGCSTNPLSKDEECELTWIVNSTWNLGTVWNISVNFTGTKTPENETDRSLVEIGKVLVFSLTYDKLRFGLIDPGVSDTAAEYNDNDYYNVSVNANSNYLDFLWIKGTKLVGQKNKAYNISIGNVTWGLVNNPGGSNPVGEDYSLVDTNVPSGQNKTMYYWIDVPYGISYQQYKGNMTIMANATW